MKNCHTSIICALVLFSAKTLTAQTTKVYITGSTAYRAATHNAIISILNNVQYGYTGGSFGGATQAIFQGTFGAQSVPTSVYTSWNGSAAGIQTVADQTASANFLPDGTPVSTFGTPGATPGTDAHHPDIAMSDVFQSTSQFNGTFNGVTYAALTESPGTSTGHGSPVGIVPFKWCANAGAPFSNITSQLCRALYNSSRLPLALFTHNHSDQSKIVVAMGRDPDSGARLTAFAESGVGALSTVKQFQPQDSAGATVNSASSTITKFMNWPAETINGVPISVFNGGYSSGGDLSKAMRAVTSDPVTIHAGILNKTYPAANVTRITYLGTFDADSSLLSAGSPSPGVELSYNGVFLDNVGGNYNTSTALTEGNYTFWGFEHLYYNSSTISSDVQAVADSLASSLHDFNAIVFLSSMQVTRATDGFTVFNNYTPP